MNEQNNEENGERNATVAQIIEGALVGAAEEIAQEEADKPTPEEQLREAWEEFGGDGLSELSWEPFKDAVSGVVEWASADEAEFGVMHQMVARQMIDEAVAYLRLFCGWTPDMIHDAVADHVPGITVRQRNALRKKAEAQFAELKDAAVEKLLGAKQAA